MATIAIFGGTGYAGSAIRDEALRRGHRVISVTRSGAPDGARTVPRTAPRMARQKRRTSSSARAPCTMPRSSTGSRPRQT